MTDTILNDKELSKGVMIKKGTTYHIYGKYTISHQKLWMVTYDDLTHKFFSSRSAITWCLLHYKKQTNLYIYIQRLDTMLSFRQANIDHYTYQIKNLEDPISIIVASARLSEDIAQRNRIKKQILVISKNI